MITPDGKIRKYAIHWTYAITGCTKEDVDTFAKVVNLELFDGTS